MTRESGLQDDLSGVERKVSFDVLKDGKEIDLYEHGEISDYDPKLLDHLREKGVKIEK